MRPVPNVKVRYRPFPFRGGNSGATTIPKGKDSSISERLVLVFRCGIHLRGDRMSNSSGDPNLTVYLKLNEAIEVINAQSRYIREIDGLFRTIANDNSVAGWMCRKLMRAYVSKSEPPPIVGIRAVDVPPVYPGTLEIVKDKDDGTNKGRRPHSL